MAGWLGESKRELLGDRRWDGGVETGSRSIPESSLTVVPLVPATAAGGDELDIAIMLFAFSSIIK